jgi:hypothetical protein
MGQACLSAVNLLVDYIEINGANTDRLIENIEIELDADQKSIDLFCFELIKNYKINFDQCRKIFGFIKNAESFERIGDLCYSSSKKINYLNNLLLKEEKSNLIILGQYVKIIMTNSIISLIEKKINEDNDIEKLQSLNKNFIDKSRVLMIKDKKQIPYVFDFNEITKNLDKIAKLGLTITENIRIYL